MKPLHWLLPLVSLALVLLVTLWEMGTAREGPGPLHPSHAAVGELRGGARCDACHRQGAGVDADRCVACHAPIGRQRDGHAGIHGGLQQPAVCGACHSEHHGSSAPLIAPHAFARAGVDDVEHYDHRHVAAFALTGAHTALPCERCHRGARAVAAPPGGRFLGLTQSCTTCHEDVHGGVYGRDCERCHGQQRPFAEAPGFAHASFPLRQAHARVACAQCHPAGTALDVAAEQQRAQPPRACAVCHADPHHGAAQAPPTAIRLLARTDDCGRCHDASRWRAARVTPDAHAAFGFPLRGAHATADCGACHGDGTRAPRYRAPSPAVERCASCHRSPHREPLVARATAQQEPRDGCAGCHRDADAKFARGTMTPAQHALTAFPLSAPHAKVDCGKCHHGGDWQQRFPGRATTDCRACHQDVHKGQFDHEPRYAQCTACHRDAAFAPHTFDVAAHAHTAFPLTGSHQAVGCPLCHKTELQRGVRAFHGQRRDCSACHPDVHQGRFDGAGKPAQVGGRTGCARCHDTEAFAPAATFAHAQWTGYALDGAHAQVACTGCHTPQQGRGERRLGPAAGRRCADCHRDLHQGQLAQAGATDCARCHDQNVWKPSRFDHQRDSRFALDKQHRGLPCLSCHLPYPSALGPVIRYKPLGTACGDCHQLGAKGGRR